MSRPGEALDARASGAAGSEPRASPLTASERQHGDARARRVGGAPGPLCEADLVALERASVRLRSLRRAVTLARVHGVGWLVCAAACLPLALFDPQVLWFSLLFAASCAGELRGAHLLRALDPRGPKWLGTQQLLVLAGVALYCTYNIFGTLSSVGIAQQLGQAHPDLVDMLAPSAAGEAAQARELMHALDGAYRAFAVAFYALLLGLSAVYQGLCAAFYFGRARVLREHVRETPPWVAEVHRRLLGS